MQSLETADSLEVSSLRDRRDCTKAFESAWRDSVEGIFRMGEIIQHAKENVLRHGEFEDWVREDLPVSTRSARMLKQIAQDERLRNRKHVSDLPASWGSLHKLSSLDDDEFDAIKDDVSPDLQRDEIDELVQQNGQAAADDQPHNTQSKSNEWWTPRQYIEAARDLMGGIDLDPASNAKANLVVQADTFYDADDGGLQQNWSGRVWLNPPWGNKGPKFVDRLVREYENGDVTEAILLVNSHSTETNWFSPLWDYILCFTDHRIDYNSPTEKTSTSTHGSVFIYLGDDWTRFARLFDRFGNVVARWQP